MCNRWQKKKQDRKKQMVFLKRLGSVTFLSSALLLTGCVQATGGGEDLQSSAQVMPKAEAKPLVEAFVEPAEKIELSAGDMYQILVAEMMALKGFEAQAFDVVFKLANKLRSAELAERAFQFSMKTFNPQKINAATVLWRDVAPQEKVPWQASFLISLRKNDVPQALHYWDRYRSLSTETLERDLLITAQKVSVSVSPEVGLEFLRKLVDLYPNTWATYFALGLVADNGNQFDVALEALEKAKSYQAESQKTQTIEQIEKVEKKINRFLAKLYLQNPPPEKGILALTPYLDKHPKDWQVQERMARLEVQASRYDEAILRYKMILESVPDAHTSRLSLALIQLDQQDFKAAEESLLHVKAQKGYLDVVSYYLGVVYQRQNEKLSFQKALASFEKVKEGAYYFDAQLHQAEIYFSMKAHNQAFEILNQIKAEQPKEQMKLHQAKGIFYSATKQNERAIEAYSKVLEIDANNVRALMSQSMLFYNVNQFEAYKQNLSRVIQINPNNADALNALGYFYADRGEKLDEAESLLKRAHQLQPDNYYILDSVGWLYFKKGNYALAKEYLQQALAVQVDDEVLVHLIKTYWKLGEKKQAKALWKENYKNFLKNDELQGLIRQLQKN